MQHLNVKANKISYVIKYFFLLIILFLMLIFFVFDSDFLKNFSLKLLKIQKSKKTIWCLSLIPSSGVTHFNILPHLLYLIIHTHTHTHTRLWLALYMYFNFCGGIRKGIHWFFYMSIHLFYYHFLKKNIVHLIELPWHLCQKQSGHIWVGLFLDFLYYFIYLYVYLYADTMLSWLLSFYSKSWN